MSDYSSTFVNLLVNNSDNWLGIIIYSENLLEYLV